MCSAFVVFESQPSYLSNSLNYQQSRNRKARELHLQCKPDLTARPRLTADPTICSSNAYTCLLRYFWIVDGHLH